MLTVSGTQPGAVHHGLGRRAFLRIGGLGLGGLWLSELLRLRAQGETRAVGRGKSVIMVYLPGGPSHIDMYDMKPDAPLDFRGEFRPVRTNVPGIDICEHMPRQARLADKLAIVRGLKSFSGGHDPYEILTSDPREATRLPPNPRPAFGSVVSRVRGVDRSGVPPYINVNELHVVVPSTNDDPETAAYLGSAYRPFRTTGPGLADLSLPDGVPADRLHERSSLRYAFDNLRRRVDGNPGAFAAFDNYTVQALDMITSRKVRDAFDLNRESLAVRTLYGEATDFLLARRLVEAGVSVVTLAGRFPEKIGDFLHGSISHWDTHWHNFRYLERMLPRYDQAIAALITDLYDRGLDQEVAVVVWGEFGRTPLVDYTLVPGSTGGRGHWPEAGFALFSGGGFPVGQLIGQTDRRAERSLGRPYTPTSVLSTLYQFLGIDVQRTFPDHAGRPRAILDDRDPIRELL